MSVLISCNSGVAGNWLTDTTWALVDSISYLDSELGTETIGIAYEYTATFTPNAITIDGVAIKLASRVAAPIGTITLQLYNNTDLSEVKNVVLNVSDLPTCNTTNKEGGWIFFKFDAATLLIDAKAYKVGLKCSVASEITTYRNATATNHSRMLRTTTNQVPATPDVLHIMGEHTSAGNGNNIAVTMNEIAATDYGAGTDNIAALTISKRGTLSYGIVAATNYCLRLSGDLVVYNGGTLNIGTVGGEIPRDSSAVLEFDCVAASGMGIRAKNGSTVLMQGLSRTIGKNIWYCKLNTDEAIGQTELGVNTDTGWLSGDVIAIAPTSRTYTQHESRILNGNAAAALLNVTVGLTYAHSGSVPTQAEIILLTRNVKIRAVTSTKQFDFDIQNTTIIDIDWTEFQYLYSIIPDVTTGSFNFQYNSCYSCVAAQVSINIYQNDNNNITIAYCGFWPNASSPSILVNPTSGTSISITNCIGISGGTAAVGMFDIGDLGIIFTDIVAAGAITSGITISQVDGTGGTFSNLTGHSCSYYGIFIQYGLNLTFTNLIAWRNAIAGICLGDTSGHLKNPYFNGITCFGNATGNIYFNSPSITNIIFEDMNCGGDTSFDTLNTFYFYGGGSSVSSSVITFRCFNGDFIGTNIINGEAPTNADFFFHAGFWFIQLLCNNCKFNAPFYTDFQTGGWPDGGGVITTDGYIKSTRHNQQNGNYRSDFYYGIITQDATYFNTATPSQKLTPNNATYKLESSSKIFSIDTGNTATVSVFVRKSTVAAGGADYSGNQPRLILKRNDAMGITADTVLDTMTVGLNTWEQLSGTTPAVTDTGCLEVVVDCDGTAGFVNIDDWEVS